MKIKRPAHLTMEQAPFFPPTQSGKVTSEYGYIGGDRLFHKGTRTPLLGLIGRLSQQAYLSQGVATALLFYVAAPDIALLRQNLMQKLKGKGKVHQSNQLVKMAKLVV